MDLESVLAPVPWALTTVGSEIERVLDFWRLNLQRAFCCKEQALRPEDGELRTGWHLIFDSRPL